VIADERLKDLLDRAERDGSAEAWRSYAEALEDRISAPHSAFLYDPNDTERTNQTVAAYVAGIDTMENSPAVLETGPVQVVHSAGSMYVLELHGQASATAHGKQGLRPERLALLHYIEEAGLPVLLAFRDGGTWQWGWLSELGQAQPITYGEAGAEASKRYGWPVSAFRREPPVPLPEEVDAREPAQGELT
jgi:hypothetical protein